MTEVGVRVIKVGGSILRDASSYDEVAGRLQSEIERAPTWVVVSAAHGITDRLVRLPGRGLTVEVDELIADHAAILGEEQVHKLRAELEREVSKADGEPHDALLAWGERASAHALQSLLRRRGTVIPLVELSTERDLPEVPSAVVPGFYLREPGGGIRCLPRGGSDISAVLVAQRLGVRVVRFWKEGGGLRIGGATIPEVRADDVLSSLVDPLRPIHAEAVRTAVASGIDLILEDPTGRDPCTRIRCQGPRSTPVRSLLPPPSTIETSRDRAGGVVAPRAART